MSDSLFNILAKKDYDEPPQLVAVKAYVKRHWDQDISGKVSGENIVINVNSAALASTIRMHLPAIRKECDVEGKLIIRINS